MGYQNTSGFGVQGYPPSLQQQPQPQWQQGPYGQQQPSLAGPAPQARQPPPAVKQGLEIACLMCTEFPKDPQWADFCGKTCSDKAEKNAPILLDVPKTDPKFADIVKQFNDTWQGSNKPTVHRICTVVNAKAVEDRFQAYRQKVEQAGNWVAQGKTAGNENRRCRLCCVIRTGFDIKYVAVGVYGLGIYTSAYSSTSHGYTRVATKVWPYRAMFLTRIVTGKDHIFTSGVIDPNAKAPPAGYDSVLSCEALAPVSSSPVVDRLAASRWGGAKAHPKLERTRPSAIPSK
ncbi:hypothetical protein FRC00_001606 [Tulasnella sp. 408]|nr:hypothetical protein FRC00_001606 [Tulasnella sp. 408]